MEVLADATSTVASALEVQPEPSEQEQEHAPNKPDVNMEPISFTVLVRKDLLAFPELVKERVIALRRRMVGVGPDIRVKSVTINHSRDPDSVATGSPHPPCKCGSRVNHQLMLSNVRELLKVVKAEKANLHKSFRRPELEAELQDELTTDLGNEDSTTSGDNMKDAITLLRGLVKKAVAKFKALNEGDHKSVLVNQQTINKLRQNGFVEEFNLFQNLHNAKVSHQSESCTSEITKLFEKCHL